MSTSGSSIPARTRKHEAGKIIKAIKLGVVGDGTVGKTTMLMAYTLHAFLDEYTPTVFDNFSVIEEVDGRFVNIILWDTAGQEDYRQLRTTTYQGTEIFLLCFSVVHPSSFDNVKYWLQELRKFCPNTPILLVGTKADMREDEATVAALAANGEKPISKKIGQRRAKEIKARDYIECSARDVDSVVAVFQEAVRQVMDKERKMWADVHKKAKKEEKIEKKLQDKIEKDQKKKGPVAGGVSAAPASDDSD